jgi:rhodanese-related sulfurtransferase
MNPRKALISRHLRARSLPAAALLMALIAALVAPAMAADTTELPHSPVSRVDRELLLGFLADDSTLTLIDARSPEEYAEQHLPGAINIPFDAVDANAEQLPADTEKPVVIYCRTGKRAGLLKEQLIAKGYADVQVLPREQIHWQGDFMVFNCSTESATTAADSPTQSKLTEGD